MSGLLQPMRVIKAFQKPRHLSHPFLRGTQPLLLVMMYLLHEVQAFPDANSLFLPLTTGFYK